MRQIVRGSAFQSTELQTGNQPQVFTADMFAESAEWWESVCANVDTVIHAAWYAKPDDYLHSPKNSDCLQGTLNLAQGAAAAGVKRFVGIGTCLEYDLELGPVSINTPLKPLTPYAKAKAAAYIELSKRLPTQEVEFAWCRLFYLFGDGEDPKRLVAYVHNRLAEGKIATLGSGTQIRDYLDVKDAARMIMEISLSSTQGAHNICSGVPTSVRQLVENIADETNSRQLLRFDACKDRPNDPQQVVGIKSNWSPA